MDDYSDFSDFSDDTDGIGWGDEYFDVDPILDFGYEHDSTMASIGWGTDEDYGYFGDDDGW